MEFLKKKEVKVWINELLQGKRFYFIKKEIIEHKKEFLLAILFLFFSSILDYLSGTYTTHLKNPLPVSDIILDNIPPMDISFLFSYGYLIFFLILLIYPLFFKIKKLHEVIIQFSLLIVIRSFFITLTHIGDPIGIIPVSFPSIFSVLSFKNDLFFSGHTAFPFLAFFIFKNEKIKYVFLGFSILLGITVLILHQHYSIDVLSAFFITYGSYTLCDKYLIKSKIQKQSS